MAQRRTFPSLSASRYGKASSRSWTTCLAGAAIAIALFAAASQPATFVARIAGNLDGAATTFASACWTNSPQQSQHAEPGKAGISTRMGSSGSLTVNLTENVSEIDAPGWVYYFASTSGGKQPYAYSWESNHTSVIPWTADNVSIRYAYPGNYTVSVTVMDSSGALASSQVVVQVNPSVEVSIEVTGPYGTSQGAGFLETGVNASANAIVSGGTPPYLIEWTFDGETLSSGSESTIPTSHPVQILNYLNASVIDSEGQRAVAAAPVFIDPVLTVTYFSASEGGIVVGQSVNFTASAYFPFPPTTFALYVNGNQVANQTLLSGGTAHFTFGFSTAGTFNVTVKVVDHYGYSAYASLRVEVTSLFEHLIYTEEISAGAAVFWLFFAGLVIRGYRPLVSLLKSPRL